MAKVHTLELVDMKAVAVGTAMRQGARHTLKVGAATGARESGQAAHRLRPLCRS